MTLLEELEGQVPAVLSRSRLVELGFSLLRLPFNGELSADELRMAEQGTFDEVPE